MFTRPNYLNLPFLITKLTGFSPTLKLMQKGEIWPFPTSKPLNRSWPKFLYTQIRRRYLPTRKILSRFLLVFFHMREYVNLRIACSETLCFHFARPWSPSCCLSWCLVPYQHRRASRARWPYRPERSPCGQVHSCAIMDYAVCRRSSLFSCTGRASPLLLQGIKWLQGSL